MIMKDLSGELITLLERYGTNTKQLLKEHSRLEYLYAFSDIRENLLEWYSFRPEARLLQIGADHGAVTGLFLRRLDQVVVLDPSEAQLRVCQKRYQGEKSIRLERGKLTNVIPKNLENEKFDYIVMIGSLDEHAPQQIDCAKQLLTDNGTLIIAVCNPFGVKYLAGAMRDQNSFSKNDIIRLLGGENGSLEWYYPIPDYRMATTIYSASYPPKKGDLTRSLAVYDHPKYEQMDVGAMFDAVCEDGQFDQFANSFLVIWRKL